MKLGFEFVKNEKFLLLIVVLAMIVSNYIGGVMGFSEGFNAHAYIQGADAHYTVKILNNMRSDNMESAISMLENKLDAQIFALGYFERASKSIYNLERFTKLHKNSKDNIRTLMSDVIDYRMAYPSNLKEHPREVREIIEFTLKRYGN
jgi:hypothetical protein